MLKPRITDSSHSLLYNLGVYLLVRLLADPETADAAGPVRKAKSSLRDATDAVLAAFEVRAEARARFDHAMFAWTRLMRLFELALLALVNKQRDTVEYRGFFPTGLSLLFDRPARELLDRGAEIEDRLAGGHGPADGAGWLARLGALRRAAVEALAARDAAVREYRQARTAEREARALWIEAYVATHGELIRRFPSDRDRVESYFYRPRSQEKSEAEADTRVTAADHPAGKETPAA